MERRLPGSDRVFVSSGTVTCRLPDVGIEWRTLTPFRALVAMRSGCMVFEDEDGRRERAAADMPRYDDLRRAVDEFAAGRADAFDGVFDVDVAPLPGGRWRAEFKPRVAAMRTILESAEVSGGELPEAVTIKSGNGTTSRIVFKAGKTADGR